MQPIKNTWREKGVTIVSDGWSDPQRRPFINFMAASGCAPIFIKSVSCFGEVKDKHFIADLMKQVIDEVGAMNVVQIITDNAPNCKGAGEIIESRYPWIYWTPCVVHTLNLALKNSCASKNLDSNQETYDEFHWITEVHEDAIQVKNFIMTHNMRLAIFNKYCSLKLLAVADTRFASVVVMLKIFKLIRRALETMVVTSDAWWEKVDYIVAFTGPIYDMIRICDTDKPTLHLVYEMSWDTMIEKVKLEIYTHEGLQHDQQSDFYEVVFKILVSRWAKSNTPLHCLAHSLNPRSYSDAWLHEDPNRVSPHRDAEISEGRIKCFLDPQDFKQAMEEFGMFSFKSGPYMGGENLYCRSTMDPILRWESFGSSTPIIHALALRVLGQPTSSSCCERNWSTYNFIHSLRRNNLTRQRAEDLVYIHNNLRLLSRNTNEYKDEKTRMWDIGGDQFDNMEEGGFLEFAELSLDEPELEFEFCSNDTN
uniref:DUF659 domain-containing protein n=1 Tax=Chenopodium quinoa TaxID=63459 RepID=A0A803L3Q9_CHEQI